MKNPITPIGAKEFRKILISFIPVQLMATVLPLAGYWYSREITSQNLGFLSILGLLFLQGLCTFYIKNFLNIKGRLKDIYPDLGDKSLGLAPGLAFIPVVAVPFFIFLSFAKRSTRKAPIFFVEPGVTVCFLALGSYAISLTPLNFLSDPASMYLNDDEPKITKINPDELSAFVANTKKDPRFTTTLLNFAAISETVILEKKRQPASVREISDIKYALDFISYNNHIVKEMDNSKYYLKNSNPIYLLSPLYVLQTSILMLIDEMDTAHFREKNVPMFTTLIDDAGKAISKLDSKEKDKLQARFDQLKGEYYNTGTYKIVTSK